MKAGALVSVKRSIRLLLGVVVLYGMTVYDNVPEHSAHGAIIRELGIQPDGGTVYEVALWPKENACSNAVIERRGRFVWYKNAQATVVISHGFMCDKFDVGFLRSIFPYKKFNSLTFDFRAHGEQARGQCCTFGRDEAYDVIAAAKFLKSLAMCKDKPLFAYGFSMGAAASIEAQAKTPLFDAMILDCPFDSSENIIKKCLDSVRFSLFGYQFRVPGRAVLQRYAFHPYVQTLIKGMLKAVSQLDSVSIDLFVYPLSPAQSMKKITIPCFFIHCKQDEKIAISAIKRIYAHAQGTKALWLTNGRRHFDSYFYNPEQYVKHVQGFVTAVLDGTWHRRVAGQIMEDSDD